jgi:mannan endo-1,4-beta-mannosidase
MNTKKLISLGTAIIMAASVFSTSPLTFADDEEELTNFPLTLEAEDCDGAETWTTIYGTEFPGYSGDGFCYLTGNAFSFTVTVPEDGMYEFSAKVTQILSEDGREQTISINGTDYMYKVPYYNEWTDFSFGMHRLKKGTNTITFKPQYGYASFDTITVKEAEFPDFSSVPSTLSDSDATPEAQSLMTYLSSVYGNNILSGQQEIYGGGNDGNYELEFDYIYDLSGEYPAIRGFDFMNYNPLYGWDDNTTERIIEWVNERGGIATASWHINIPKDFDSWEVGDTLDWTKCTYADKGSFSVANAMVEGTKENAYWDSAIEMLAEQLQRLQDANVPIILRPLHEAEGNSNTDGSGSWFWWGQEGAETYVQLWKYLYNKLTDEYGLHNIIWEQNLYAWSPDSAKWYAGDDYVDIVGYDKYNCDYNRHDGNAGGSGPNFDAETSIFYTLVDFVNNNKMVSMAENDTIPSLDNLLTEHAAWLYFCPWYGEHILDSSKQDADSVKEIYQSDYCITLGELPANLYSNYTKEEETTSENPSSEETTVSETEEPTTTVAETTSETVSTTVVTDVETTEEVTETEPESESKSEVSDTTESTEITETSTTVDVTEDDSSVNYGDVNSDGNIDVGDVVLLNKYIVQSAQLSASQEKAADCNKDSVIDSTDALTILKYLVMSIESLPVIPED